MVQLTVAGGSSKIAPTHKQTYSYLTICSQVAQGSRHTAQGVKAQGMKLKAHISTSTKPKTKTAGLGSVSTRGQADTLGDLHYIYSAQPI